MMFTILLYLSNNVSLITINIVLESCNILPSSEEGSRSKPQYNLTKLTIEWSVVIITTQVEPKVLTNVMVGSDFSIEDSIRSLNEHPNSSRGDIASEINEGP